MKPQGFSFFLRNPPTICYFVIIRNPCRRIKKNCLPKEPITRDRQHFICLLNFIQCWFFHIGSYLQPWVARLCVALHGLLDFASLAMTHRLDLASTPLATIFYWKRSSPTILNPFPTFLSTHTHFYLPSTIRIFWCVSVYSALLPF